MLLNQGTLLNEGQLFNDRFGRVDGLAVVRNVREFRNGSAAGNTQALFSNAERFENVGNFINYGVVNDVGQNNFSGPSTNVGQTDNSGTITNQGSYSISGELLNGGTFSNETFLGEFFPESDFISGRGQVDSTGSVQNTGTFANGGVLLLDDGTFTNESSFQNAPFSVSLVEEDEFNGFTLSEVTGFVKNKGMFVNNGTLENRGRFENHGEIVNEGLIDSSSGEFENTGLVSGSGEFRGVFRNSGTLEASAASVVFGLDTVVLRDAGALSVELGGDSFAESGLFQFGNAALLLDGEFRPVVLDDLVAEIGDSYVFATADNIDLNSTFDSIDHSLAGQYRFAIDVGQQAISVRVVDIVAVPEPNAMVLGLMVTGGLGIRRRRRNL